MPSRFGRRIPRAVAAARAAAPVNLRGLDPDRAGLDCMDVHAPSTIDRTMSGRSKWTMWPALGTHGIGVDARAIDSERLRQTTLLAAHRRVDLHVGRTHDHSHPSLPVGFLEHLQLERGSTLNGLAFQGERSHGFAGVCGTVALVWQRYRHICPLVARR